MALAHVLEGAPGIYALSCDTDGVDGLEEIAGAVIGPQTLKNAGDRGMNTRAMLDNNDGHSLFEALEAQVITGPTLTNVNDFRAILIE
ncbi:MOFRL family protein [Sulfitobacter pacificus]|uniref:MOFRL family protein n=1 Tax=Sulfitobacter pacificus TaxID=1499314 RepID=UPI0036108146